MDEHKVADVTEVSERSIGSRPVCPSKVVLRRSAGPNEYCYAFQSQLS